MLLFGLAEDDGGLFGSGGAWPGAGRPAAAVAMYRAAALQGYPMAQHILASLYAGETHESFAPYIDGS